MHPPLLWLPCLLAACAHGPGTSAPHARLDALMADDSGQVPGTAVLVLHDGQSRVRRGCDLAGPDSGRAVTTQTGFRLAPVRKPVTAAAILLLANDGASTLDDRARKWLPSQPASADAIILHHLLTHALARRIADLSGAGGTR